MCSGLYLLFVIYLPALLCALTFHSPTSHRLGYNIYIAVTLHVRNVKHLFEIRGKIIQKFLTDCINIMLYPTKARSSLYMFYYLTATEC